MRQSCWPLKRNWHSDSPFHFWQRLHATCERSATSIINVCHMCNHWRHSTRGSLKRPFTLQTSIFQLSHFSTQLPSWKQEWLLTCHCQRLQHLQINQLDVFHVAGTNAMLKMLATSTMKFTMLAHFNQRCLFFERSRHHACSFKAILQHPQQQFRCHCI